jgi:hypothetical protein
MPGAQNLAGEDAASPIGSQLVDERVVDCAGGVHNSSQGLSRALDGRERRPGS